MNVVCEVHDFVLCRIPFGAARYPRPCIVVQVAGDHISVLGVSTKQYGNQANFKIETGDVDFPATGLSETSFVYGAPVAYVPHDDVFRKLGSLQGELKKSFVKWIG